MTSSYIPSAELELTMSENEHSLKSTAIRQILLNCSYNPLRINGTTVCVAQIGMWFAKCVEVINVKSSQSESRSISHREAALLFDPLVNDGTFVENQFDLDVEMIDLSDRNAQEKNGSKTKEINISENDPIVRISSDVRPLTNRNVQLESCSYPSKSLLLQIYNNYRDIIRERLNDVEYIDEEYLQRQGERILKNNPSKLFLDNNWLKLNVEQQTEIWISVLATMLRSYNYNFTMQLREKFCIEENKFEELHRQNLMNAFKAVKWDKFPRKKLNELFEKLIENQKSYFWNYNNRIFEQEKRIAKEAYDFAVMNFKSLMEEKLSSGTFSKHEFQLAYHRMSTATLELFLQVLEPPHTQPWMFEYQHLQETLTSFQTICIQQNKNNLMKVDLARKEAVEAGKQCYQDEMRKTLPGTKLSKDELFSVSQFCYDRAMQIFHQKIGKNIGKNISVTWEDEMKVAINEIKLLFVAKNDKLLAPFESQRQPLIDRFGIGLYIDPQSVRVCVDQQIPSDNRFLEYDNNIAIVRGDIFFGERASAVIKSHVEVIWYNTVFGLLIDQNGFSWPVNIAERSANVGQEELLSLYFNEIRLKIEQHVNHKVSSCFVAVTGLLTSGAKQILKASLTLAGFDTNTLISSTTAMAISYSQMLCNEDLSNRKTQSNLFIYTCANLVEVAAANVSNDRVMVQNVCGGDVLGTGRDLEMKLKNYLLDNSSQRRYNKIIFCFAIKSASQRSDFVCEMLRNLVANNLYSNCAPCYIATMELIGIAALLDSVHNGYLVVPPIPLYNFVHPYKICVEIKGQRIQLTYFNNYKEMELSMERCGDVQIMTFTEEAKSSNDRWIVGRYFVVYRHTRNYKTKIQIVLKKEGNLLIRLNEQGDLVNSNVKSMTNLGWQNRVAIVKPIIAEISQKIERKYSASKSFSSSDTAQCPIPSSNTMNCAIEKLLQELKKSVSILIEKTKDDLRISKLTTTTHRDNIESKISKCEALMKSSNIKVKQLEIEKCYLERAAKYIK